MTIQAHRVFVTVKWPHTCELPGIEPAAEYTFVKCHFSSLLPFPRESQRNVCVFVGLQWFSLLDFFLTCRKSETWPWMMSWFWMWTPTPWKPPLMTSRASRMTWWVMSPWVLTPGSSCSGREHAFGEEKGWIQLWFSCSLRTAVGFCYLWNLCLSEGSWEVVHFFSLVLLS